MGSSRCQPITTSAKTNTGRNTSTQSLMTHKLCAGYANKSWGEFRRVSHLGSSAKTFIQTIKMPKFKKPCLVCGGLSFGSYCPTHEEERRRKKERERPINPQRMARKAELYNYAYRQEAKRVKAEATHCHICGQPFQAGDRVEADHLIAGSNEGGLAAAHRLCNQRRGAKPL